MIIIIATTIIIFEKRDKTDRPFNIIIDKLNETEDSLMSKEINLQIQGTINFHIVVILKKIMLKDIQVTAPELDRYT